MKLKGSLGACASMAVLASLMAGAAYAQEQDSTAVEGLVITGSSIRGVAGTGSPSTTINIEEMKASGAVTASDVARLLPQVFNLGADESRNSFTGGAQDAAANSTAVRSVNLRGVGPEATLLVVNGRRVPPSGIIKAIADIDSVPSNALARLEVVADGASAIYGSDAVAGVANLITRKPFDGAETTARYGFADGYSRYVLGQTLGKTWEGGGAFFAFESNHASNLSGADRDFASQNRTGRGGTDLRPFTAAPGNVTISNTGAPCTLAVTAAVAGTATCVRYQIPNQNGVGLAGSAIVTGSANRFDEAAYADLLPEQNRDGGFLRLQQQLTDTIDLWFEGFYTYHAFDLAAPPAPMPLTITSANPYYVRPAGAPAGTSETVEYRFLDDKNPNSDGYERLFQNAAGFGIDLPGEWRGIGYASFSEDKGLQRRQSVLNNAALTAALNSTNPATAFNPFGNATFNRTNIPQIVEDIDGERNTSASSRTQQFLVKADGPVFDLPGGPVKVAVGADYNKNKFNQQLFATNIVTTGTNKLIANQREITAGFAEIFLPFVGADNAASLLQKFDVSVAVRYEDYSDFGETTNPKVGIVYGPTDNITFRGTYGTSFRAPSLVDTSGKLINYFSANLTHPTLGVIHGITFNGGNPSLGPEEATTYTGGVDYESKFIKGLKVHLTYYKIDYSNRIDVPGNGLTNPAAFGQFVTYRPVFGQPDAAFDARVAAILASPDFQNAQEPVLNFNVISDGARHNIGTLKQDGVDLSATYDFESEIGDWTVGLDVTEILNQTRQTIAGQPFVDTLDTFGNPIDWRGRASLAWHNGGWSAYGFVNYTDTYMNTAVTPNKKVDSYVTADVAVGYTFEDDTSIAGLKGVRLALNVQNLLDQDPPIVLNGSVSWDNQAAQALGRLVQFEISKRW